MATPVKLGKRGTLNPAIMHDIAKVVQYECHPSHIGVKIGKRRLSASREDRIKCIREHMLWYVYLYARKQGFTVVNPPPKPSTGMPVVEKIEDLENRVKEARGWKPR